MKTIYQEKLLDHYKHPRNKGVMENPDFASQELNPSCGDSIKIQGTITDDDVVKEIMFTGKGCIVSQAAASLLMEHVQGKSINELLSWNDNDITALIGIDLGPTRLKCALLSLIALQKGLKAYQKRHHKKE